jgi:hypothetical protein
MQYDTTHTGRANKCRRGCLGAIDSHIENTFFSHWIFNFSRTVWYKLPSSLRQNSYSSTNICCFIFLQDQLFYAGQDSNEARNKFKISYDFRQALVVTKFLLSNASNSGNTRVPSETNLSEKYCLWFAFFYNESLVDSVPENFCWIRGVLLVFYYLVEKNILISVQILTVTWLNFLL